MDSLLIKRIIYLSGKYQTKAHSSALFNYKWSCL